MTERLQVGPAAGKPSASAAIWPWGDDGGRDGRARAQRKAGLIRAVVGVVAGGALFWLGRPSIAAVAWTLAGVTFVLAMASPLGAYAALDRWVQRAGRGVGLVLTWLLLAPAYYLVLTPLAWFIRRRRDPLRRTLERDRDSYWAERASRPLDRPY